MAKQELILQADNGEFYTGKTYQRQGKMFLVTSRDFKDAKVYTTTFHAHRALEALSKRQELSFSIKTASNFLNNKSKKCMTDLEYRGIKYAKDILKKYKKDMDLTMRYFRNDFEYFALVKARTLDNAVDIFIREIACSENEREVITKNMTELSRDEALVLCARSKGEDGDFIEIEKLLMDFNDGFECAILVDAMLA